ncbi:MAG TPA: proton-conducting transporter membrane subunit [Gaiella sp.]|uniref:proton-conducting transporter transmembrane domain-containing protein n=1 Tax=Gaiella sp. TaxID=2663207 RepID=UPI002D7FE2B1|nr:proton-conducting transporter membrane subunit [Gaiella sp.]HET9287836.1 proton-conducting transporter membrane subunit [Gaiella sp.]
MSFAVVVSLGAAAVAAGGLLAVARRSFTLGLTTQGMGCALLAGGGLWALVTDEAAGASFTSAFDPRVGIDGLSGLFLGVLGAVGAAALVFATRYLQPSGRGRAIGALTAVFVLVQALVLVARDPLTFLVAWEAMTLVPAAVILVARADELARRTVFFYVALTHLAGAGTWVAILLLAREGAIGDPSVIASGSGVQIAIALAALVGMGAKAGLMPLHVWLPLAHPIAPAHVSALMSGVMIKIAIYGLIRVLVEWLGVLPEWLGVLVLGLGALSSVAGVVYALFQHELKRLLAFHSIENIGIIVLGLGACLVLRARGADAWAAFALAAALLHTVNHALFKALLFLGAGSFEKAVGSLELDRLGGLIRRMPWTGGAFLVGAVAIAGLPPLNGFASEWTTLQSLLRLPAYGGVADGTAGALALAALAATAALAALCFVKVVGLVLLGPARRDAVAHAQEAPVPMRAGIVALAGACVLLGVAPGLLFGSLVGLAPWASAVPTSIGLDLPGTGLFRSGGIALVLVALVAALYVLRGRRVAAPAPTWACGQLVERRLDWTSAGFTKALRLVLEDVLRPEREIDVRVEGGVVQEVAYEGRVPHLFEERLYRPLTALAMEGAHHARRMQSGRLGTYVGYLLALVLVVLTAAKLGVLG